MNEFEKDSFWLSKGPLLGCKRTPFAMQNEPFWKAKGLLLFYGAKIAAFLSDNCCFLWFI